MKSMISIVKVKIDWRQQPAALTQAFLTSRAVVAFLTVNDLPRR
jgi:hypothetical protein